MQKMSSVRPATENTHTKRRMRMRNARVFLSLLAWNMCSLLIFTSAVTTVCVRVIPTPNMFLQDRLPLLKVVKPMLDSRFLLPRLPPPLLTE